MTALIYITFVVIELALLYLLFKLGERYEGFFYLCFFVFLAVSFTAFAFALHLIGAVQVWA